MKDWKATHRKAFFWVLVILSITYTATSDKRDADRCRNRKMDLVVIMDGTISLGYKPFNIEKQLVLSVLEKMTFSPRATQVSVIQFSDQWNTVVEMEMGTHGGRSGVLKNVSKIEYQYGRRTLTGMAMHMAYEQFFGGKSKARPGVDKAILLITDGGPADRDFAEKVVRDLKEKQVRIVTVATGTRMSHIQKFRYIVRSIASGFKEGFRATHYDLLNIAGDVAKQLCKTVQPPSPTKGKSKLIQKCFQEKKDILFALDGSIKIDSATFKKALGFVARICGELDITPSLIHVGMIQYSDLLNTRIEFGLQQYTKYYQINASLQNIIQSKGRRSDLKNALSIIDKEIFNGQNGDRISAEDFLVLFVSEVKKQSDEILEQVQRLKAKGVHVIIIGLGKPRKRLAEFYEKLASHPNDVNYLDEVKLKHIMGDLTAITCRKVNCEDNEAKNKDKGKRASEDSACKQKGQDVLFMLDTTRNTYYFQKTLKFFTKIVKKLNIAATTTHVGLMTFGKHRQKLDFELGKYNFENDINKNIWRVKQWDRWRDKAYISAALRKVNKKIFNTSTGGYRKDANDLILIATRGNVWPRDRYQIQKEVKILKAKGVRIAVLDVGYKNPNTEYLNTLHDIASGARDIYPMDFRRASTTAQALLDVQCREQEKAVSPRCFIRSRQILFMLDSSEGLSYKELPQVLTFLQDIVKKLYTAPNNIEIGVMHYSDQFTASFVLSLEKRTLDQTLKGIQALKDRYREGKENYLGNALKYAKKIYMKRPPKRDQDQIIVLLAHNQPADPDKAFKISEKLRSTGVQIVTVAIHTAKTSVRLNPQYRALATSRSNAHSFDLSNLANSSIDVLLNLCELNACPKDSTKDCTPKKQDIFMVVDSSRSIGYENFPHLRRFIRRLVNKLDISQERSHIGILQASDRRRTEYEMKLGEFTNPKEIENVINDMGYHQGYASYIGRGLEKAIRDNLFNVTYNANSNGFGSNSDRSDAENVLMIYSDGIFHDQRVALKNTDKLKKHGARVVIVGLGPASRTLRAKKVLGKLASSRSDIYLVNLKKSSLSVEEELNEVTQHVTTLQCNNLYQAPIQCSPESLDLFVVIDGSRSVGYVNFGKVQEFLKKLADEFTIGQKDAHFGVLQYGAKSESRIEFNLGDYLSNKAVSKAIERMKFLDSRRTQTGDALSIVNKQIFNGKGVDRPGIQNILILFTDGIAHDIRLAYRQAKELKKRGTRIIAIGAGREKDRVFNQISPLASRPEDAHKSEFDKLSGIVEDLLDVVCQ